MSDMYFCSAFHKVYSFAPTFRADVSRGRKHLSEFYMVEAEVNFLRSIEDINNVSCNFDPVNFTKCMHSCYMQIVQNLIQHVTSHLLTQNADDLREVWKSHDHELPKVEHSQKS